MRRTACVAVQVCARSRKFCASSGRVGSALVRIFDNRAIARSCSISPTTVSEYVRRAQAADLRWPLPETLDEDQLFQLLFPKPARRSDRQIPEPDWQTIHTELRLKGVTRRLLWLDLRSGSPSRWLRIQSLLRALPSVGQEAGPSHAAHSQGRREDVRGLRWSDDARRRSGNR